MVTLTDPNNTANTYSFDETRVVRIVRRRLKKLDIPGTTGYIDKGFEPLSYDVTGVSDTSPPSWLESLYEVSISGSAVVPDGTYLIEELRFEAVPPLRWRIRLILRVKPPNYYKVG